MDHSSLPSSNSACFPSSLVPEFDGHLPLGKFQQELAQAWHPTPSNLLKATKIPDNSFGFGSGRLPPAFAMEGLRTPPSFRDCSELAGNSMASESWDAGVGRKLSYASSLGSILPASRNVVLESSIASQGKTLSESSTGVTELVGRMEMNGNGTETLSSILASSSPLSEVERLITLGSGNWGSLNGTGTMGLTVDPLKGGLAIQGTNLAASCCLPDFSTDPGFAERAAKFSCFSSQNYPELAQRFSVPDGGMTLINRSTPRASDKITPTKITRISSGHLTPRCSAPNSPVGAAASGSAQGQSCMAENFSLRGKQESTLNVDDLKGVDKLSGRTSCSPSRIDGSDRVPNQSTSMNDSEEADGSLGQEESSSCERDACDVVSQGLAENPGKKRRIGSKGRSKDSARAANLAEVRDFDTDDGKGKRPNIDEAQEGQMPKVEQTNSGNSGDSTPKSVKESSKPPDAGAKSDFIHVRARRGQATDSHSLAERVRREKISERMKFLQDLVPGCSKVTGKAVMLDEIINYVQSLQRQVEFLSMRLAAVNPRVDLNIESLFGREIFQPRIAPSSSLLFAPENSNSYPQLQQAQCTVQGAASCSPVDGHSLGSDSALRRTVSNPVASMNGFADSGSQQISQAWDDELQSVVQMGFTQGRLLPGQMKIEL